MTDVAGDLEPISVGGLGQHDVVVVDIHLDTNHGGEFRGQRQTRRTAIRRVPFSAQWASTELSQTSRNSREQIVDSVYKKIEVVGTSTVSVTDAINTAVAV